MIKLSNIKKTILAGVVAITMLGTTLTAFAAEDDYKGGYIAADGQTSFDVSQTWNMNGVADALLDEQVRYTIEAKNPDTFNYTGVSLTPDTFTLDGIGTKATQTLTFTSDHAGVFTYYIKAEGNAVKAGYTYDDTVYTIRAYVKRVDGELVTNITAQQGDDTTDKVSKVTFAHTFQAGSSKDPIDGKYDPPVKKYLTGDRNTTQDTFTFQIIPHDDNPADCMPESEFTTVTPVDEEHRTAEFGEILFPVVGTYRYDIVEIDDGQTGYHYDGTVYTVIYVVTEVDERNEDGEATGNKIFHIERTFEKDGEQFDNPLNRYEFTNKYTKPEKGGDDGDGKRHDGGGYGSVMVYKVDAASDDTRIAGVQFEVTKTNGDYVTTITTDDKGMAAIDSLPVATYRLKEMNTPAGYQAENRYVYFTVIKDTTIASPTNVKVTNTKAQDVLHLVAIKAWANVDGVTTPDSVTFELQKDGAATGVTQVASAENNWTVDFGLVPADGATYEVVETAVPEHYIMTTEKAINGSDVVYTITNTYENGGDNADHHNGATGDESNMILYAGIMGAAMICLAGWFVYERKNRAK